MRSGTLPHPLVVGIGAACEIAAQEMTYDLEHVRWLSKRLVNGITSQLDFVVRNGDPEMTYEGMLITAMFYSKRFVVVIIAFGSVCTAYLMSKIVILGCV